MGAKYKNLSTEVENVRMRIEEEADKKNDTLKALSKAQAEIQLWRSKFESELEEMQMEYERVHAAAVITEKRGKNFDKVVGEWKCKADALMAELEASRAQC